MPRFGTASRNKLNTCDSRLIEICEVAIKVMDFSVICGERSEAEQNALYEQGKTFLRYPGSQHNKSPSKAVDLAPYPIDWEDRDRFILLAGIMHGAAEMLGYKLRWGGDWDRDFYTLDNNFNDLPHFQILD